MQDEILSLLQLVPITIEHLYKPKTILVIDVSQGVVNLPENDHIFDDGKKCWCLRGIKINGSGKACIM